MAGQRDAALTQGLLSAPQVEIVKAEVSALADSWVALGLAPTRRSAGGRILRLLYEEAQMREGERHVHLMPAQAYSAILGRLARLRAEIRSYRGRLALASARH
jgi:hypothetical protein